MFNRMLARTACSALAVVLGAAAIPKAAPARHYSAAAADTAVKYEFEDGKAEGCFVYPNGVSDVPDDKLGGEPDLSNHSGKGFTYLDQKNSTLSIEVDVPESGLYELAIAYCEPSDPRKKVQYLNINGVNQGEVTFPYCKTFEETSAGIVTLKKGKNTIELKAYWGYTFFDYLTITPADKKYSNLSPTASLSNPKASDTAKRLYKYLRDQYGNHILAGQQEYCGDHNYISSKRRANSLRSEV